jgi:hypothetical protein
MWFGAYPNHMHITIIVKKQLVEKKKEQMKKKKQKKNTMAQIGTNVRVCGFNTGLLARSQFASRRSCDRSTLSRFSVVFLGPVGISHMSDIRQMSVVMQRIVDFISMVTNSTLLRNNTGANSMLICNNTRANSMLLRNNTKAVTIMERNFDFCWFRPNITTKGQ